MSRPRLNEKPLEIFFGDCRELAPLKVSDSSVDLIFTDPPYPKAYLPLYKWLADEAVRALKPDGFLITYAGPYWKNEVMRYLGKRLDYFYDFILVHKGNTSILWPRKVISGYKSILCYTKKGQRPLPRTNVLGQWDGTGGDKRFHRWGQEAVTARYYVDCFSKEGDLVVDYFLGGGTTAKVCKRLRRQFVGFEIDPATFDVARARVDGAIPEEAKVQAEFNLLQAVVSEKEVKR